MRRRLRPLLTPARETYEARARRLGLDRVAGRWDLRGGRESKPICEIEVEGTLPAGLELLVSTGTQGVLHLRDGTWNRRLAGKSFGITRLRGRWIAFQLTALHGVIREVFPSGRRDRPLVHGLSQGIHQIDVIDDHLVVVDTYHNRLLRFPTGGPWPTSWRRGERHVVGGELADGRRSGNYHHFNSVFAWGDAIHLMAHNDSTKTGRRSECWVLDRATFEVREVRDLGSHNAHNYWTDGSSEMWCDSHNGGVMRDGQLFFKTDAFVRGLSIADDVILVGDSDVQIERARRNQSDGRIHVVGPDGSAVAVIHLRSAPVQDLRRLDRPDQAMSSPEGDSR
jgi:hypothetical protein